MAVRFQLGNEYVICEIHKNRVFLGGGGYEYTLAALASASACYHNGTDWVPCWEE